MALAPRGSHGEVLEPPSLGQYLSEEAFILSGARVKF